MFDKIKDGIFTSLNYIFFTLFTILCVFPLYYILVLSVSANDIVQSGRLLFYPVGFHLQNYFNVFEIPGLLSAFFISLSRTVIGTSLTLVASVFLGFMFAGHKMLFRTFLYRAILITMYFSAGLIPWYLTMRNLHLTNNFLAYILPYIVTPFYIILCKTFIESVPASLEESAHLDGADTLTVFFKIIVPVSKPIIATVTVFESVNQWNRFTDNLFLMNGTALDTLQIKLYNLLREVDDLANMMQNASGGAMINPALLLTPTAIRMSIAIVVVVPILLVYPFMQRYFVKGIMVGAIKG